MGLRGGGSTECLTVALIVGQTSVRCSKDLTEVSKIVRRANETLLDFKKRWTEEMGYIQGVPEVMRISSFMSNSKCPELARRFADQVPQRMTKMMKRVDDFVKSEEAYKNTELPKGEHPEKGHGTPYKGPRPSLKETVGGCPLIRKAQPSAQGREVERSRKCKFQNGEEDWMNTPITFPPIPSDDVSDEPLISETEVEGYLVRRVFLDQGRIDLEVMFESEGLCRRTMMKFTVVQASSLYNIILGRTGIRKLRAISSTTYAMMKFPTLRGIATCVPRTATIFECRQLEGKQALPEEQPNEGAAKCRESSIEEEGMINTVFPDQKVTIGIRFSPACRLQLITLLKDNKDVFAWQPADMVEVPRRISQHSFNVNSRVTQVAQKQSVLGPKKSSVVIKEVGECIKAGIVRLIRYPTWISNPVLIDLKIEAVMGFPFKCFLDAYKGYHQIQMSKEDEEKTAFYTDQETYCCTKMSFGLKNTGETYQRLVNLAFQTQLGRNLEAYVDDMVIRRKMERDMIIDIAKTFDNLGRLT
ncbi:hypothetical protein Tco_1474913 [Tanacetum coccineum]